MIERRRRRPPRLSTRLGLAHGVLVALLLTLLVVTLQGLLRMVGLITEVRDERLSALDADEELHHTAWQIEVALRHGATSCLHGSAEDDVRAAVVRARDRLRATSDAGGELHARLLAAAQRYGRLAEEAIAGSTCAVLAAPSTQDLRAELDEEMTDAWIDRLQEVHSDLQAKEEKARRIGTVTAVSGLSVAVIAAIAAVVIVRTTERSVSAPIARLAAEATRVGEGDFAPIPRESGLREVEDLWHDLERARQRLQELDELKQQFLANVSHELRSPLAPLREALSLLGDGTVGELLPEQKRVLALASRACEREVRIVEALLDIARLRSGMPAKFQTGCDIDRVLEGAVRDEREEAAQRGVSVELHRLTPAPPTLELDAALIERAVANLVRNAISVSRAGQSVRVSRAFDPTEGRVRVDVADCGPGVSEELRPLLFRPFSAVAVDGLDRPAGIGLGLSFARDVARVHGGDLTLASTSHDGTTFRFELPVAGPPSVDGTNARMEESA